MTSNLKVNKKKDEVVATEPENTVAEIAEVAETEPTKEVKAQAKAAPKIPEKDRMVLCRNITNGTLVYISKRNGTEYILQEYGDCEYLSVDELIHMKGSQPMILTEPWLIIEDDEVVDFLKLRKIYDSLLPLDDMPRFFMLPIKELESYLEIAPMGIKSFIASKALEMYELGEFDSLTKIQLIEKMCKCNILV